MHYGYRPLDTTLLCVHSSLAIGHVLNQPVTVGLSETEKTGLFRHLVFEVHEIQYEEPDEVIKVFIISVWKKIAHDHVSCVYGSGFSRMLIFNGQILVQKIGFQN